MQSVEGNIKIDAPMEAVMAVLGDFSTYPAWSGFRSCEVLSTDGEGRASKVSIELSAGPLNAKYTIAVSYLPGGTGLTWTFVEGSGITDTEGEYRLAEADGGTLVNYRGAVDMNLPMPGFMKKKLIAEGQKVGRDKALKGLKDHVESR
ncbi:MAG: SRPBCC family protein [Actinomycetota bacterium]